MIDGGCAMFKTQEEILEWLLEHPQGSYEVLGNVAGKVLTRQLELLGCIRRGENTNGNTYALTQGGKRMAIATLSLQKAAERGKVGEESYERTLKKQKIKKRKRTKFEKLILSISE